MICPYFHEKVTTTDEKKGITVTKEKFMECKKEDCPYYNWKDWHEVGQGCTKARMEIEREASFLRRR